MSASIETGTEPSPPLRIISPDRGCAPAHAAAPEIITVRAELVSSAEKLNVSADPRRRQKRPTVSSNIHGTIDDTIRHHEIVGGRLSTVAVLQCERLYPWQPDVVHPLVIL